MKTLIAVPCMDNNPVSFTKSLLFLERPKDTHVMFLQNTLIYDSRNMISFAAIEQNFDRVLWLDSDMTFNSDTLKRLNQDLDNLPPCSMVTALYLGRREPYLPLIFDQLDEPITDDNGRIIRQSRHYEDYPKDSVFPIKGCGFGCVLMNVSLLKAVGNKYGPPFSPLPWAGEDLSFCYRVNSMALPMFCDSSIKCGHAGQTVLYPDNAPEVK